MGFSEEFTFRDCPWCGLRDAHMIALALNLQVSPPGNPSRTWSLLACPRCGGAITIETSGPNVQPVELSSVPEGRQVELVADLPEDVRSFYEDAVRVLDAGVPDATAVQLRRALEAAAAHHDVDEKTLVKSIQALIDKNLITSQFGQVLHHVRKVGNVGAHASDERVDEASARRALRFTTQILRNLFEIPAELRRLEAEAPEARS